MGLELAVGNLPDRKLLEPLSEALGDREPLSKHNNRTRGWAWIVNPILHTQWGPSMLGTSDTAQVPSVQEKTWTEASSITLATRKIFIRVI